MKKLITKRLSALLAALLTLCTLLSVVACASEDQSNTDSAGTTVAATVYEQPADTDAAKKYTITFKVVHSDGSTKEFPITTDEEYLGAALLAENLISGETSEYGLYVKVVDGETADYDVDQSYWALYIGADYAATGVDSTPITDGGEYSFIYTK